jgi:Fe-Mn family superoxide dismutase
MLSDVEINRILMQAIQEKAQPTLADKTRAPIEESYNVEAKQAELATERLSEANKRAHKELHQKYVEALNTISAKLDTSKKAESSANHSDFRSLKMDETFNHNGAYLHDLFFENISDLRSEITVDSITYMRLQRDFGDFDAWQRDFIACCLASRCGWAVTGYSLYLGRYINTVVDLHATSLPIGFVPVIVMDMWQHSYYRDYLNDARSYVIAMMKELNWSVIDSRVRKMDAMILAAKPTEAKNG